MKAPEIPADEAERLRELRSYDILDTEPERDFDETAELAAHICETPIALMTLIDEGRQWYKAHYGAEIREHDRHLGICPHVILQDEVFEIPDLAEDERFQGNPLIEEQLGVRFYAGMPITGADGHRIGSICVIDYRPRRLSENQHQALRTLSRQITHQLALRRERKRNELLLREMRHRVQNGYQLIENLVFLHRNAPDMEPDEAFQALSDRVAALSRIQKALYTGDPSETIDLKLHLSQLIPEIQRINEGLNPHLAIHHELESLDIDRDKAVSAGLIVNELITNAVKHAFPEPSPEDRIDVRLTREADTAVLTVADNGVGADSHKSRTGETSGAGHGRQTANGASGNGASGNGASGNGGRPGFGSGKLGTSLVHSLASDLGGSIDMRGRQQDRGTEVEVRWPAEA